METGHKLGPYEILEQLGAGGMGEVWLAQDTRLGRKVAVKVLPEQYAGDPERLARFEQEARASAALNHPHIAAVFDIGAEGEGDERTHYMVQEYLQGSTVREALGNGALSLDKALALGTEIAEALRAAHRAGIVHRDLKPDNIFITEDGHAKVLDFGLAKLIEMAGGPVGSESMSPTILGTQAGAVMGTAGYMAPEQVQGEEIDHRADLFAFGCVLYELVTGKQPFAGRNVYDTLSRIVDQQPEPVTELDAKLPVQLQWILRKCLVKAPADRYQGAGDLAVDLKTLAADVAAGRATTGEAVANVPVPASVGKPAVRLLLPLVAAALVLGALGAWVILGAGERAPRPVRRFTIEIPEGRRLTSSTHPLAVSPDGETLVVLAIEGSERWLEVRRLDQLEGHEVPGTRGLRGYPFFSPDGRWLAYVTDNNLMKVSLAGEPPQTICPVGNFQGATWTDDGYIVFADERALYRVPAVGGTAQPVPVPEGDTPGYYWPSALPGGDAVLVNATRQGTTGAGGGFGVGMVNLADGSYRTLVDEGQMPAYLPTGHVAYGRDGFLFAAPFDAAAGALTGEAFPVLEGVYTSTFLGQTHYAFGADGTLVHAPPRSGASGVNSELVWIDMEGGVTLLQAPRADFHAVSLSPDGRRVAAQVGERFGGADVYVYEIAQGGASQRLTVNGNNVSPRWSREGEWVIFSSDRGGDFDLYRKRADFSGDAELLLARDGDQFVDSIEPDGKIVFTEIADIANGGGDIAIFDPETGEAEKLLGSEFWETNGRWSPDGRYLAFQTNTSGRREVYVLEPETGRRQVVSNAGGQDPLWSPAGDQLFYDFGQNQWVVDVDTSDGIRFSEPRRLFERGLREGDELIELMGASPEGDRFLGLRYGDAAEDGAAAYQLVVTLNWFEEVRQRAEAARER